MSAHTYRYIERSGAEGMQRFTAFDIETAKITEAGADLLSQRPLPRVSPNWEPWPRERFVGWLLESEIDDEEW